MDIPCQILITTFLNEQWSHVDLHIQHSQIDIYRNETIKQQTSKIHMFSFSMNNICGISQDPDNYILRLESRSIFANTTGCYTIKFHRNDEYQKMISCLIPFKHVVWSNK
jgi:hypothetical protein